MRRRHVEVLGLDGGTQRADHEETRLEPHSLAVHVVRRWSATPVLETEGSFGWRRMRIPKILNRTVASVRIEAKVIEIHVMVLSWMSGLC